MRKIIITEFVSVDNVFEDPGGAEKYKYGGWTMPFICDEFMNFKGDELKEADALLLGRITYDGFAKAWPERKGDWFSDKFNSMPKYVVSKTLHKADWENSHIVSDNVVEEIKKLEGTVYVHGSGQIVRFLLKHKLLDQINLLVYPVVLGEGKRLFEGGEKESLKLVEEAQFSTGIVKLIYTPK